MVDNDNEHVWNSMGTVRSVFDDEPPLSRRESQPRPSNVGRGKKPDFLTSDLPPPVTNRRFFQSKPEEDLTLFTINLPRKYCQSCGSPIVDQTRPFLCEGEYLFCQELCLRSAVEDSVEFCSNRLSIVNAIQKRGSTKPPVLSIASYTSFNTMKLLLKYALKSMNSAVILKVLIRIHEACDHSLFLTILFDNPRALDHFISHLKQTGRLKEAYNLLLSLGRTEDAQMMKYKEIRDELEGMRPSTAQQRLEMFVREHMSIHTESLEYELINEHIRLLQVQAAFQESGALKKLDDEIGGIPQSVQNRTLVDTVHYHVLCKGVKATQDAFMQPFKISEKSFVWMALQALVLQEDWPTLFNMLKLKKFRLSSKNESILPPVRLIFNLYSIGISGKQLQDFFVFLPDNEALCSVVTKLKLYNEGLGHCLKTKNKKALEALLLQLPGNAEIRPMCERFLAMPTNTWPTS